MSAQSLLYHILNVKTTNKATCFFRSNELAVHKTRNDFGERRSKRHKILLVTDNLFIDVIPLSLILDLPIGWTNICRLVLEND